MSLPIPKRPHN